MPPNDFYFLTQCAVMIRSSTEFKERAVTLEKGII